MKADLNQLKNWVTELIRINDLTMPDNIQGVRQLQPAYPSNPPYYNNSYQDSYTPPPSDTRPIITEQKNGEHLVISEVYDHVCFFSVPERFSLVVLKCPAQRRLGFLLNFSHTCTFSFSLCFEESFHTGIN